MEIAKVTTNGQIIIPKVIMEMLELKEGSKILFVKKGEDIVIKNSAMIALEEIQNEFDGEAERLGLKTEDDIAKFIKDFRN